MLKLKSSLPKEVLVAEYELQIDSTRIENEKLSEKIEDLERWLQFFVDSHYANNPSVVKTKIENGLKQIDR